MAIPKLQAYALPEASDIPANKVNWAFEPSRAALLIHDMQEYFLNFWGENSAMMEEWWPTSPPCASSANRTIFRFFTPPSRKSRAMKTARC
jgi:hypothetical protein